MKIESQFDIGDKVKTHLGDEGVVDAFWVNNDMSLKIGVDLPGGKSTWCKESQLTKVDKAD